jgi:hypothetical protein
LSGFSSIKTKQNIFFFGKQPKNKEHRSKTKGKKAKQFIQTHQMSSFRTVEELR